MYRYIVVGSAGPKQSVDVKNTIKLPAIACRIVRNSTTANFSKKLITVKSIIVAPAMVVKADARIDGPISSSAYRVLPPRFTLPGNIE
jgi:hypothetical protein